MQSKSASRVADQFGRGSASSDSRLFGGPGKRRACASSTAMKLCNLRPGFPLVSLSNPDTDTGCTHPGNSAL